MNKTLHLLIILLVCLCFACGDDDAAGSGMSGGTVTDTWSEFCVATFTESHPVTDTFDDQLFTASEGSQYLMTGYGDSFGELRGEMVYLTSSGPIEFEVVANEAGEFPFTTDCTLNDTTTYLGVFQDLTFHVDEALTTVACNLEEGAHAEGGGGYALVSDLDFTNLNAPAVYEVSMGGLAADCNNHETTYVTTRPIQQFGTSYYIAPVQTFIGP